MHNNEKQKNCSIDYSKYIDCLSSYSSYKKNMSFNGHKSFGFDFDRRSDMILDDSRLFNFKYAQKITLTKKTALHLANTYYGIARDNLFSYEHEFILREKSLLNLYIFNQISNGNIVIDCNFKQLDNSELNIVILSGSNNNSISKVNLNIDKVGANTKTSINGIQLAKGAEQHISVNINHKGIGDSVQNIISFSGNSALTDFVSVVNVDKQNNDELQKIHQNGRSYLLDKSARAFSRPQLNMNTDNIECSHGISIGPIDELWIEYLMSRGLTENDAKKMIIASTLINFATIVKNRVIPKGTTFFDKLLEDLMKNYV